MRIHCDAFQKPQYWTVIDPGRSVIYYLQMCLDKQQPASPVFKVT